MVRGLQVLVAVFVPAFFAAVVLCSFLESPSAKRPPGVFR